MTEASLNLGQPSEGDSSNGMAISSSQAITPQAAGMSACDQSKVTKITESIVESPDPKAPLTLKVGERRFITCRSTLTTNSDYFDAVFSGRWPTNTTVDGAYFLDADPEMFEHILNYCRRGVMPLFWDKNRGFDVALYGRLLQDAAYFQVKELCKWIKERKYVDAVKVHDVLDEEIGFPASAFAANEDKTYCPSWRKGQVYQCPRGIALHMGSPSKCGRQCQNAMGDGGPVYAEEDELHVLVVTRKITYNHQALLVD